MNIKQVFLYQNIYLIAEFQTTANITPYNKKVRITVEGMNFLTSHKRKGLNCEAKRASNNLQFAATDVGHADTFKVPSTFKYERRICNPICIIGNVSQQPFPLFANGYSSNFLNETALLNFTLG